MFRRTIAAASMAAWLGLAGSAQAQNAPAVTPHDAVEPRIGYVRIEVADLEKSVDFYKRVLLTQDINRSVSPVSKLDEHEAALKFGSSGDKARSGDFTGILLAEKKALKGSFHAPDDVVPVLVLTVPDMAAVAKRATEAGATFRRPVTDEKTVVVSEIFDPSRNVIEFIQLK